MFQNCISLKELNLSNFNTSKTICMENMFENCSSLKNLDISNFDIKHRASTIYICFLNVPMNLKIR